MAGPTALAHLRVSASGLGAGKHHLFLIALPTPRPYH